MVASVAGRAGAGRRSDALADRDCDTRQLASAQQLEGQRAADALRR